MIPHFWFLGIGYFPENIFYTEIIQSLKVGMKTAVPTGGDLRRENGSEEM